MGSIVNFLLVRVYEKLMGKGMAVLNVRGWEFEMTFLGLAILTEGL